MKYNKTLEEIKHEYGLEFLNFFYVPIGLGSVNAETCWCSLKPNPKVTIHHDGNERSLDPVTDALELKYLLHRMVVDDQPILFIDIDERYTDLTKLRQDIMILSISNL